MDHEMTAAKLSKDNESHQNFMEVVYRVNNIACLYVQNDDDSLSAQWEVQIVVTEDGYELISW